MREEGLRAKRKRRFRSTTDSTHGRPVAPDLLKRQFSVEEVGGVDRVWVSGITYLPTRAGQLYLAVVLDLASRRVVGWAMKGSLESSLATDALTMALWGRRPARGLLVHSYRGVQYASEAYRAILAQHGIRCSMSRKGDCWDNAVAESFFATLEWELPPESPLFRLLVTLWHLLGFGPHLAANLLARYTPGIGGWLDATLVVVLGFLPYVAADAVLARVRARRARTRVPLA